MATLTGPRAAASFPVPCVPTQGELGVAWGYYNLTAAPSMGDIIHMCKLPAGATVIDGWLIGADIDTGTETLDLDVGWAANGAEAADPDGFGNMGVLSGDATTERLPVAGIRVPFANIVQDSAYKTFTAETTVTVTVTAAAAMGGTGYLKVIVHYVGGGVATA